MIVLAIDPGSRVAGYAVLDLEQFRPPRYVECGVIKANRRDPTHVRLSEIRDGLDEVVAEFTPELAVVEEVHLGRHGNVRAVVALARAQGVALASLGGVEHVRMVQPSTWRRNVQLSTRAAKSEVAAVVHLVLGMGGKLPPQDASDALAMALVLQTDPQLRKGV